jgi:hypothetical protein
LFDLVKKTFFSLQYRYLLTHVKFI